METQVKQMIDELGVVVIKSSELKKEAYYFPSINLIVINSNLSETDQHIALLHELGHASLHLNNYKLYTLAFSLHSKMEHEADEFMLEKMIETRMRDPEFDPATFNSINFLESCNIDLHYETVVKQLLENCFIKPKV